ncbi:MAG: PAS domain-containing protein [Candidatus Staskawiczbacteria bacterium]|nr:PAS domain-containing protein [Candidatus Staskawiczbacteria bacterium]
MESKYSGDFYKSIFDNMFNGLAYCQMIFDAQGRPIDWIYIKVNKNFNKLTGLKRATGKKVTELIPGIITSNPELFKIYGRVSLTGKSERFETYVGPLSRWFLVSVYSPKKKFFVAVFDNITKQKRIVRDLKNARIAARNVLEDLQVEREELAKANAKNEAMLLSIGDSCVAFDKEEKIILMNEKAIDMLQIDKSNAIGRNYADLWNIEDEHGNIILPQKRPIWLSLTFGKVITTTTTTYWFVRKDKTKFPVALTVTPIIYKEKIIGAIAIFRDITKEKEIDKAKTEFISLASHQLRTPLVSIKWYSEMLLGGEVRELTPKQKKYIRELYQGNERMINLVRNLLNVSQIEMGVLAVSFEPTDIRELLKEVIKEQMPFIQEKKHKVVVEISEGLPKISTDSELVRIIFQNLFGNAIEYTPAGGKITCTAEKKDNDIIIGIKDMGIGIPEKQQTQIFQKLFRGDNAVREHSKGTGLGLYITKAMVDALSGKIWFKSKEGEGTTFWISLPFKGPKIRSSQKNIGNNNDQTE